MRRLGFIFLGVALAVLAVFVIVKAQMSYLKPNELRVGGTTFVGSRAAFGGNVKIGGDSGASLKSNLGQTCAAAGDKMIARRVVGRTCKGKLTNNTNETPQGCEPTSCTVPSMWQYPSDPLPTCQYKDVEWVGGTPTTACKESPSACYAEITNVLCVGD